MRRRRGLTRSAGSGPAALAGWLFAELAMVLVVVAFGSYPMPEREDPSCPHASVDGVCSTGLSLQTKVVEIRVTDPGSTLAEFRADLDRLGLRPGQVGLVLLFGVSRDSVAGNGTEVSEEFRDMLGSTTIPEFSDELDIRAYHGSTAQQYGGSAAEPGMVSAELFVFAEQR